MNTTPGLDIVERGWAAVTVRVAWTLVGCGVAVKSQVLRDARDHVWLHLPPAMPVEEAEDRAELLTVGFVVRARGKVPPGPVLGDELPLSRVWRDRLHESLSRNTAWVLRMHLADGHALERVAERLGQDLLTVEAALEGLREVVRRQARRDGQDVDAWTEPQLDRLLKRLACMAASGGPPLLEVVDGLHPDHLTTCIRATRAYNLVRSGVIERADLVSPRGEARPRGTVSVLVLQFQRRARHWRTLLAKEVGGAFPVGEDLLLLDAKDEDRVRGVVELACEVGRPRRDDLRGARFEVAGRWSRHGLLGTGVDEAIAKVSPVSWTTIEGWGDLPEPLPNPPSARWGWVSVLAGLLLLSWLVPWAFRAEPDHADFPLEVEATAAREGWWLAFDVDDAAHLTIVRRVGDELEVAFASERVADKIRYATGDGSFRLFLDADAVLVASASAPYQKLPTWIGSAELDEQPLTALAAKLYQEQRSSDIRVFGE